MKKVRKAQAKKRDREIRKEWTLNPCTRIEKDKKKYNRKEKHKGKGEDE